jgi:hypothetical protein
MNATRDPETILAAWLDEGPTDLPDVTRRAILTALPTTPQARRGPLAPWRFFQMTATARLALGALVAVIAVGGALYLFGPSRYGSGGPPIATPTVSPSVAPSPPAAAQATPNLLDTSTWTAYTSNRYGFTIGHPADWTERPSDHVWTLSADVDFLSKASEGFTATGQAILVTAWSVSVPSGTSAAAWIQAYCLKGGNSPCTGLQSLSIAVSVDGNAGSLIQFVDDTQAFILVGNRMYVVAVWRPDSDPSTTPYQGATQLLKTFISTMHLLPGGPASPIPSVRPS